MLPTLTSSAYEISRIINGQIGKLNKHKTFHAKRPKYATLTLNELRKPLALELTLSIFWNSRKSLMWFILNIFYDRKQYNPTKFKVLLVYILARVSKKKKHTIDLLLKISWLHFFLSRFSDCWALTGLTPAQGQHEEINRPFKESSSHYISWINSDVWVSPLKRCLCL